MSSLETIFSTLDTWRHLPAYRLELRVDIFFGIFLPKVIAREYERCESDISVIPEFPLHKKTLGINEHNDSLKADFAVFSRCSKKAFLVELKTDKASIKSKHSSNQRCHLFKARDIGLRALVEGIIKICKSDSVKKDATKSKKYAHLLFQLEELGLVKLDNGYKNKVFACYRSGLKNELNKVRSLCNDEWCIEVVYIQPCTTQSDRGKVIDFVKFASHVKEDGGLGKMFADYLDKWKEQAGERNPWSEGSQNI